MTIPFQFIADNPPGEPLEAVFSRYWPAYQRWMKQAANQDLAECRANLAHHMPELVPVFENLLERFGHTDEVGRFLTLYNPPRVVRACTQIMLDSDRGPVLLRSYDHDPRLIDGIILRSTWRCTPTLALTDCLWGALDGMNAHGVVIALAFGGRNAIGDGFAASLICRYVLETCSDVAQARAALARLPVYMPYTFAVLDAAGNFVTAFLGPDVEAKFVTRRASTNHQGCIDWPAYASFVETAGRLERVEPLVAPGTPIQRAREAFLSPPVWRTQYAKGSGTLYVAEYAPSQQTLRLHWPGHTEEFNLGQAADRAFAVDLPGYRVT